ncbi:phospholipase D-like domain-containing protein [Actinomadura sp. DC4]|uniref:phospholipase D-like domain-containing protein n=1 Tax=Actinomadura sp. DC4 TaxID=3055069 RepID=UPI0025B15DA6|nr:phospholipase D-like domain-containing protein [Actinomadura sp. DC4]MDN3354364.1 phospholipase D-like domain-containing protein [Actinomadura sp. DC4]
MKRTVALAVAALVVTVPPVAANATVKKAKAPSSCESRTFTSTSGAKFNDPEDPDAQLAIMGPIIDSINGAGCGQTIRVAMYSISDSEPGPSFADALVAAHQRGVIVKVLMDKHSDDATWQSLVAELGNDPKAPSFAALCPGGCLSHYSGSFLHAKFYMFSGGSDANRSVTVSSANPTGSQASTAWNSSETVKGNVAFYNSYANYFTAMSKGAVSGSGPLSAGYYDTKNGTSARTLSPPSYQWPRATSKGDVWLGVLNNVKAPAELNLAMFQWTAHGSPGGSHYLELPKKLVSLAATGVKVHILMTAGQVDDSVQAYLKAHPKNIDVHDTTRGVDVNGNALHYTHDKYLAISGTYAGVKSSKIVFTGSNNWTINAAWHNDESDVKLIGATPYNAFLADWHNQYARCCGTSTLQRKAEERAEGTVREIPIDPRQALE